MSIIRPRGAHERHSIPLWVVAVLFVPGPAVFLLVDGFAARAGWVAVPVMLLLAFAVRYYIRREVGDTEGQSRTVAAGTAFQELAVKNSSFDQ